MPRSVLENFIHARIILQALRSHERLDAESKREKFKTIKFYFSLELWINNTCNFTRT